MKLALSALILFAAPVFAFAAPSSLPLDFSKSSAKPYAIAVDVTSVANLSERTGFSAVVQTVVQEGSLNSNKIIIHVISPEGQEAYFAVKTDLAAVGGLKLKWENAAGSSAGLYLTLKGLQNESKRTLEIKLSDATGEILTLPLLNLY